MQVVPYGLTRVQQGASPYREAGIDARYALTPPPSVYGTLFPDFATIEADQEQVNLTRFEVSLREKRQFFLEGQEQFNQRIRTFCSRRITDITGGAKLLGKQGPWTMAFVGAQGDVPGAARDPSFVVGRAQRDVSGRSTIAMMGANRRMDGIDQGSFSADANLFFSRTIPEEQRLPVRISGIGLGAISRCGDAGRSHDIGHHLCETLTEWPVDEDLTRLGAPLRK